VKRGEGKGQRRVEFGEREEEGNANARLRVEEVAEQATEEAESSVESKGSGGGDGVH